MIPMTPKQRNAMHRGRENQHVRMVRYNLRNKQYVEAFRNLAWALEQSTAADAAATEMYKEKADAAAAALEPKRAKARKRRRDALAPRAAEEKKT